MSRWARFPEKQSSCFEVLGQLYKHKTCTTWHRDCRDSPVRTGSLVGCLAHGGRSEQRSQLQMQKDLSFGLEGVESNQICYQVYVQSLRNPPFT
jgi:hypothetical protein